LETQEKKNTEGRALRKEQNQNIMRFIKSNDGSKHIKDFDVIFDKFFEDKHSETPSLKMIGKLFCDGIKLSKPSYFNEIEKPMEWLKLRIAKYFVVKSIKDSGTYQKAYFIRIDDNVSFIDGEFFDKIVQMMNDIRNEIKQIYLDKDLNSNDAELKS
jgi:hypothetical protein